MLTVALIGWFDAGTHPDVSLSLLYLVPIAAAGWWLGPGSAIVVAALAAVGWSLVDLVARDATSLNAVVWRGVTRLGILTAVAVLTGLVRNDRQRLRLLNAQLAERVEREAVLARTDALTGLPNLRAMLETLGGELARAERSRQTLALAYIDLDLFKQVNDRHGHSAGDQLLREVAEAIRDTLRAGDVAARIGGDEFAVVMVGVDAAAAREPAERLRTRLKALVGQYPGCEIDASIGIAIVESNPSALEPSALLACADQAVYAAKAQGRGRTVVRQV
jgi:diguanylate cyclase (GGDEF)-like protein